MVSPASHRAHREDLPIPHSCLRRPACLPTASSLRGNHEPRSLTPQDPEGPVTLRTSKFITNRLLNRKQFVLTVLHPTRPNVSRTELSEKLASLYKTEKGRVVVFGLRTKFGGGSSQGFGLVYDDEESQKKFEPRYRLVRVSDEGSRFAFGPRSPLALGDCCLAHGGTWLTCSPDSRRRW